ncbi:hypothetical protein QL285_088440 [Trifolium repens]|nr:hypothetical protein QL285_088440 [Trifolium repens]
MANVFVVLILLAYFHMSVSNAQFISYGPDCITWMANTAQCQLYYLGHESRPDDSCCLEIEYISTDSYCLCESAAINNSFSFDVTKALTLPSVCGVTSPCDGYLLANGSTINADNLVPSQVPESKSPTQSFPSESRPELGPSYAPNFSLAQPTPSPAATTNTKSSGSLTIYPYSILVVIFLISFLFLYFP